MSYLQQAFEAVTKGYYEASIEGFSYSLPEDHPSLRWYKGQLPLGRTRSQVRAFQVNQDRPNRYQVQAEWWREAHEGLQPNPNQLDAWDLARALKASWVSRRTEELPEDCSFEVCAHSPRTEGYLQVRLVLTAYSAKSADVLLRRWGFTPRRMRERLGRAWRDLSHPQRRFVGLMTHMVGSCNPWLLWKSVDHEKLQQDLEHTRQAYRAGLVRQEVHQHLGQTAAAVQDRVARHPEVRALEARLQELGKKLEAEIRKELASQLEPHNQELTVRERLLVRQLVSQDRCPDRYEIKGLLAE